MFIFNTVGIGLNGKLYPTVLGISIVDPIQLVLLFGGAYEVWSCWRKYITKGKLGEPLPYTLSPLYFVSVVQDVSSQPAAPWTLSLEP